MNRCGCAITLLLALQTAIIVILAAAGLTGWTVLPAGRLVFTIGFAAVIAGATAHICRDIPRGIGFPGRKRLLASGSIGMLSAFEMALNALFLTRRDALMYVVCALINGICCFALIRSAVGGRLLRLCAGISVGVLVVASVLTMTACVFSDPARFEVVGELDSPDGRYTAEIIDSDDKMTGAQVRVRLNRVLGVPVRGTLDITKILTGASGDREPEHYEIAWADENMLIINGWECGF